MQTLKEVFLANSLSGNHFTSLWELSYLCQKALTSCMFSCKTQWKHHMSETITYQKKHLLLTGTAGVEVFRPNRLQIYLMACSHQDSEAFLHSTGKKKSILDI